LVNQGSANDPELDFTLEYDVPPENRADVQTYLKAICKIASIKTDKTQMGKIIHEVEIGPIEALEKVLEKEHQTVREILTGTFSQRTAISSDPVLAQVAKVIPTVGVLTQYKSDFEKEVVILLKLL
jgi:CRISPR/Cas system-associated exonuclease Cas4 (RecB family)